MILQKVVIFCFRSEDKNTKKTPHTDWRERVNFLGLSWSTGKSYPLILQRHGLGLDSQLAAIPNRFLYKWTVSYSTLKKDKAKNLYIMFLFINIWYCIFVYCVRVLSYWSWVLPIINNNKDSYVYNHNFMNLFESRILWALFSKK